MCILRNKVLDISNNYYKFFTDLENVNGVGFGFKYINGINTSEPCIHVLVDKKINSKYLPSNNVIPKSFMGIKTDVIETSSGNFLSGGIFPSKSRPLEWGCNISTIDEKIDHYGTLSCIVTKRRFFKKEYFILSNNHVLADFNKTPIGTPIIQPSKSSILKRDSEEIANLSSFIKLKVYNGKKSSINKVDCALAKITEKSLISNRVFDVGQITGISKANLGLKIKKIGATTGLTKGKITTIDAVIKIKDLEDKKYVFQNQMIADIFNVTGDSGSLVLNDFNEVVGIFWGGTGNNLKAYIHDIKQVLKALKVNIYIE